MQASERKARPGQGWLYDIQFRTELGKPLGHLRQEQKHLTERETSQSYCLEAELAALWGWRNSYKNNPFFIYSKDFKDS